MKRPGIEELVVVAVEIPAAFVQDHVIEILVVVRCRSGPGALPRRAPGHPSPGPVAGAPGANRPGCRGFGGDPGGHVIEELVVVRLVPILELSKSMVSVFPVPAKSKK